jgi:hypothetical protein
MGALRSRAVVAAASAALPCRSRLCGGRTAAPVQLTCALGCSMHGRQLTSNRVALALQSAPRIHPHLPASASLASLCFHWRSLSGALAN